MGGGQFSMSKGRVRAGARVLPLAASPIKREILRKMLDRPVRLESGDEYRITPGGRGMLFVAFVIERWLQGAPRGPIPFDSEEAELAVDTLVETWSSTLMHALAREPLTIRELNRATEGLSRRALKRLLVAMQSAGQVEARPDGGEGALYADTDWLRTGIAPIAAAARLERRDPTDDMAPIAALDVEAAFLLTLPLLELPAELSGSCRLEVDLEDGEGSGPAGATVRVQEGRVTSCEVRLDEEADAWASASAGDWLDTVIEPDAKSVRTGGDRYLARVLLDALHRTLFGIPVDSR
jgi:DNA-binding transcriptional ArsR family regulator